MSDAKRAISIEVAFLALTSCSMNEVLVAADCVSNVSASASLIRPACTSARARPLSADCCGLAAIFFKGQTPVSVKESVLRHAHPDHANLMMH